MSNEMFQGESQFEITYSQELAAREAMLRLAKKKLAEGGERANAIKQKAMEVGLPVEELILDEFCEAFGWEIRRTDDEPPDEICGIGLLEDFSSDEDELFKTLVPYVTPGSFINLNGESSGGFWETRYGFTGKRVVELEKGFPPVPVEE